MATRESGAVQREDAEVPRGSGFVGSAVIWSKLMNPWSWSPGADDEYTRVLQEAYQSGHADGVKQGYATGVAHGELMGRLALAVEIERYFSPDAREALTAESAERVRLRQVH